MQFMIRIKPNKRKVAHYFEDDDTYCRMWSTGGMRQSMYGVFDEAMNLPICKMCKSVYNDMNPASSSKPLTMKGGICPCGGVLAYSSWETVKESKERVHCKSCGRSESASTKKELKQPSLI